MNLFKCEQTLTTYHKSDFGDLQIDQAAWNSYQKAFNDFLAATRFLEDRLRGNNESYRMGVIELGEE